jgi:hypothetical protein
VRRWPALLLALPAAAFAATAYVSDDLILGVYADQNPQSARLATLHSGASVETLASTGEFTQVRLADGTSGWVKSSFLVTREPAAARVKRLEEELSRAQATTPELNLAAARSEALQLKGQLTEAQADLAAARGAVLTATGPTRHDGFGTLALGHLQAPLWAAGVAAILALSCGFWLGYGFLARRVRRKFGGIKVY